MEVWEAIAQRASVRQYRPDDVSPKLVHRILEAAISAPSAGNRQPWHFWIVRNPAVREALSEAAWNQRSVAEAPVVIVVCTEAERSAATYGQRGRDLYCIQDTAAAVTNILLMATALELGTCWVGAFDETTGSWRAGCARGAAAGGHDHPGIPGRTSQEPYGSPVSVRRRLPDRVGRLTCPSGRYSHPGEDGSAWC